MNKKIYFLFGLVFFILASAIYLHRKSLLELDKSIELIDNTYAVNGYLNEVSGNLKSVEIQMQNASGNAGKHLLENDFVDIITGINQLKSIVANKGQKMRVDTISAMINDWRKMLASDTASDLHNPFIQAQIKNNVSEIQSVIDRCISKQKELLAERQEYLKYIVKSLHRWTIILIIFAFLLVVFTSYYGYRQTKNRIDLEVLLESILNASQEGIITCKTLREGFKIEDFEILFANSAVKTHLGQNPADLIGKSIFYIMPEIQSSGLLSKWIQVVEDGLPDEYEAAHRDTITNKDNWYSVKLVKLGDGVTVTFHNITELRGYKQNLNVN